GAVGGTGALRSADALAARPALAGGRDAAAVAGGGTGRRGHRLLPRTAGSVEGRGRDRRRAVGGPGNGTLRLVAAAPGQWQPRAADPRDVGHGAGAPGHRGVPRGRTAGRSPAGPARGRGPARRTGGPWRSRVAAGPRP